MTFQLNRTISSKVAIQLALVLTMFLITIMSFEARSQTCTNNVSPANNCIGLVINANNTSITINTSITVVSRLTSGGSFALENSGSGTAVDNEGTISGNYGIFNTSAISINNTGNILGTISGSSIFNVGTITRLNNVGNISGAA